MSAAGLPGSDPREEPAASWQWESVESLARRWGVPAVHAFRRVGSTNDVAGRLARGGVPAGTVVVAEEQVAGRGRAGRGWASPPGLGLWLSMVLRPDPRADLAVLPLLVGLAAARSLDALLGHEAVRLKWPNDLLVADRKLAGILCEASWAGDAPLHVVAGIGVNVLHEASDFPEEIRPGATSLRAAGADASLGEVAARLVPALHALVATPLRLDDETLAALAGRDGLRGRRVSVSDPATGAALGDGWAEGIGADGALRIRDESGRVTSLRSGTVRTSNAPR